MLTHAFKVAVLRVVTVLACFACIGTFCIADDEGSENTPPPEVRIEAKLHEIAEQLRNLNTRVADLEGRMDDMGAAPAGGSFGAAGLADTAASRIYVVIAADSLDSGIGNPNSPGNGGAGTNASKMEELMKYIGECKVDGKKVIDRMDIATLGGGNFTYANLERAIKRVPKDANATLFVYLSCHGAFQDEHFFQMPSQGRLVSSSTLNVRRSTVWRLIKEREVRQSILISDSCATAVTGFRFASPPTLSQSAPGVQPPPLPLAKLLLFHEGYVDINGCSPPNPSRGIPATGELGIYFTSGSPGGFFTHAFFEASIHDVDAEATGWHSLLSKSRKQVQSDVEKHFSVGADGYRSLNGQKFKTQTPTSFPHD